MTDKPVLEAVAFDLDGLMFNTEDLYQEVGNALLRRRGKEFTAELLDAMMGRPTRVAMQIMIEWHALDLTVEQLAAESDAAFPAVLDARLEPMPGLLPLLETLERHGIPKAVATSSRRTFVEDVLARFDLIPRFEFLLTCEDIVHGKPAPDIYQLAARRLGIDCGAMMVLEDSENGCRAAVTAGAFTVAVPGAHSQNHDFAGVRFRAESLADPRIYQALGVS
jgi:HAD superfamily hydrolase (TIGR01509 family)